MTSKELLELFENAKKRYHIVGDLENGVIIGLDLEGRLFTVLKGKVVNRVNPEAVTGQSTMDEYLNPGGDGLWPAPEGTALGYEYAAGTWRVPPSLTGARYLIVDSGAKHAEVQAEIDLINAKGIGVPTIFKRSVSIEGDSKKLEVRVIEEIKYIGTETFERKDVLLVPWTLCQFDSTPGDELVFPGDNSAEVWDLYDSSAQMRSCDGEKWKVATNGCDYRFQVAMGKEIPWIQFNSPKQGLTVYREAKPLEESNDYIDITDAPVTELPSDKGVKYSVYSDPSGFMEIEAAGGAPKVIEPGTVLKCEVLTIYSAQN